MLLSRTKTCNGFTPYDSTAAPKRERWKPLASGSCASDIMSEANVKRVRITQRLTTLRAMLMGGFSAQRFPADGGSTTGLSAIGGQADTDGAVNVGTGAPNCQLFWRRGLVPRKICPGCQRVVSSLGRACPGRQAHQGHGGPPACSKRRPLFSEAAGPSVVASSVSAVSWYVRATGSRDD